MENQVRLYTDGQVVEFKAGVAIRQVATQGDIRALMKALKFSRSPHFVISSDPAPTDKIPQSRGGQHINDVDYDGPLDLA
jgi:hypothetical protein